MNCRILLLALTSTALSSSPSFASNYNSNNDDDSMMPVISLISSNQTSFDSMEWLQKSGLKEKCENEKELRKLDKIIKDYPEGRLDSLVDLLKSSGAWGKLKMRLGGDYFFEYLKTYPEQKFQLVLNWINSSKIKPSGIFVTAVSSAFRPFENLSITDVERVICWTIEFGIMENISPFSPYGSDIDEMIKYICTHDRATIDKNIRKIKNLGAWELCTTSSEVSIAFEMCSDISDEFITTKFSWQEELGKELKCKHINEMADFFKNKRMFSAKIHEAGSFKNILSWMGSSGLLNKINKLSEFKDLMWEMGLSNIASINDAIDLMKSHGLWDRISSGYLLIKCIRAVLHYQKGDFSDYLFELAVVSMEDPSLMKSFLKLGFEESVEAAKIIFENSDNLGTLKRKNDFFFFYIFLHHYYLKNPAVPEKIKSLIANAKSREYVLEDVCNILGEDHPYTQECLNLALGYDNQDNPDGFLAVHQEMIKRSQDVVIHNSRSGMPGVTLNLESVCQLRPYKPIHMPVNVWHRLFDELNNLTATDIAEFESMLNISWAKILSLRDSREIQALLDPLDSLKTSQNVSSHSQMLRSVLNNIQETGNTAAFLQLLVNITTCTTGKLNGIMHSHVLLNQGRALDEGVLGSERFTQEIKLFLNEEFRRIREATLSTVVRRITHDGVEDQNTHDIDLEISHDIYYLRGIIGREIGLHFENETPSIDMDAYLVNEKLRSKTKQELLDLFYQHYRVEDLIDRFHAMLNDGTLKITDDEDKANLTTLIINLFLKEDAMDEEDTMMSTYDPRLVELDQDKKPIGLTKEAANRLLILLGFLNQQSNHRV